MTQTEPPMIIILFTLAIAVFYIAWGETGDQGRYRLFHEIEETVKSIKLTHTCDEYGFFTSEGLMNCVEKNGFRYQNTGTFIAFYRMDAVLLPHPIWTASLNPYSKPHPASLDDLRAVHAAFVKE